MRASRLLPEIVGFSILLLVAGCGGGGAGSGGGKSGGGGASGPPTISSLSPTSILVGSAATSLRVYGSNFDAATEILWNGAALPTTLANSGEVYAVVPASDLATAANVQITVSEHGSAAGASAPLVLLVSNPKPEVSVISPQAATVGDAVTLTATGKYFAAGAQFLWNGEPLTTTAVNSTTITARVPPSDVAAAATASVSVSNPGPGGGASASLPFIVLDGSTRMMGIQLNVKDIVWDATHGVIYASVPGTNGSAGYVEAINPVSGKVVAQVAAGSAPNQLAISSDDSELWVGEDDTGSVERFALPGLTSDLKISLPKPNAYITQTALSLRAAPGNANTVAMLLTQPDYPPQSSETIIYDGATPRPATVGDGIGSSDIASITWGADATVLYGSEIGCETKVLTICDPLDVMSVDSAGVSVANSYPGALSGMNGDDFTGFHLHFDPSTGYLYTNDGRVLDPATGELVGEFDVLGIAHLTGSETSCVVDATHGLVFFVGQRDRQQSYGGYTIEVFDKATYRLRGSLTIPLPGVDPGQLSTYLGGDRLGSCAGEVLD